MKGRKKVKSSLDRIVNAAFDIGASFANPVTLHELAETISGKRPSGGLQREILKEIKRSPLFIIKRKGLRYQISLHPIIHLILFLTPARCRSGVIFIADLFGRAKGLFSGSIRLEKTFIDLRIPLMVPHFKGRCLDEDEVFNRGGQDHLHRHR